MPKSQQGITSSSGVFCPHCEFLHRRLEFLAMSHESDGDVTCERCEKPFYVDVFVSYTYESSIPPFRPAL